MSTHAFLAPSAAGRWVHCALAPTLEAAYPELEPSPETLEGTAAHWVLQRLMEGATVAENALAPNGTAVTDEMLEAAEMAREELAAIQGLQIEQRVSIPRVHPSLNWGTPDYYAWGILNNGRRILRVWDYKYGYGIVEVEENWQLIDYACGILEAAGIDGIADQETVVELVVIQPRAFHAAGPVRRWRVLAADLRPYINQLANAAAKATGSDPLATPHPDACKHCRGRFVCEALQREAYRAVDMAQSTGGGCNLSAHALGLELRSLTRAQSLLAARISGLEEEAAARIKRGEGIPFWSMTSVPGRLAWTRPAEEVFALGDMLGLSLRKSPDAITPTQAKKLGFPEALLATYAARPVGAAKLTYDDGKKARLTFASSST